MASAPVTCILGKLALVLALMGAGAANVTMMADDGTFVLVTDVGGALSLIQVEASIDDGVKKNILRGGTAAQARKHSLAALKDESNHTEPLQALQLQSAANSSILVAADANSTQAASWFSALAFVDDKNQKKSKVILVMLEIFYLGLLGIDRMYMGQMGLGILKMFVGLCTCGIGAAVWGLIDWFIVIVNCLESKPDIHTLGFHAEFGGKHDIQTAWWLALIGFAMAICPCGVGHHAARKKAVRN